MTTTTSPSPIPVATLRPASSLPWLRHSLTLAGRSIRKTVRHPEQFFDVTLQPALFLIIFVYVLGGAIAGSTHDYPQFVLPGILIQTVLFSTVAIAVNLNTDIKEVSSTVSGRCRSPGPRRWSVPRPTPCTCWPPPVSCCASRGACAGSRSGSAW